MQIRLNEDEIQNQDKHITTLVWTKRELKTLNNFIEFTDKSQIGSEKFCIYLQKILQNSKTQIQIKE